MPMLQSVDIQDIEVIYEANALFASERKVSGFGTVVLRIRSLRKPRLIYLGEKLQRVFIIDLFEDIIG